MVEETGEIGMADYKVPHTMVLSYSPPLAPLHGSIQPLRRCTSPTAHASRTAGARSHPGQNA